MGPVIIPVVNKLNVEFKARIDDIDAMRDKLRTLSPRELGLDHQRDIYFEVPEGRLKLREGGIEQSLIYYRRSNEASTRDSHVVYANVENTAELRSVLTAALPVLGMVEKDREIYYVGDTKIHLDRVQSHGCFLEVEAPNPEEASRFFAFFGIKAEDLEGRSYSDFARKNLPDRTSI
jgi:adenylate cyclase class 2